MQVASPSRVYRFGPYELRPQTRQLLKHGTRLKLRLQPFQILTILVEHAGEVVSREKLRETLWSKETFVDFERGLNTAIKELRAVLSDSVTMPRYIETVPKLGYRILIPVQVETAKAVDGAVAPVQATEKLPEIELPPNPATLSNPVKWRFAAGVSLFAIVSVAIYLILARSTVSGLQPTLRQMLAVLPFENLTGDPSQDYFSDGMTEEMIGQLGNLDPQRLGVIARTSVMHYKDGKNSAEQVGRELGVQYVLEGSVRREANHVRITAQLIRTADQSHVWSRQYDRELNNALNLQKEIALEIGEQIQLTLSGRQDGNQQVSSSPANYEAYDLYLKGRYFWNKRDPQSFRQAIDYFHQAINKDPTYALAYAGLAETYALQGGYDLVPQRESMPKARAAALKALELNAHLAEAHTSLALIAQNYDWDWQTAEKEYRQAIELNPNYATAHHWYAEYLSYQGRFDEALTESERARQLDPLSLIIATDNGTILYYSRQYDRAIAKFHAVSEMEPDFVHTHFVAYVYVEKGQTADALANIEKWRPVENNSWRLATEAYVYDRSGQRTRAQHALGKLQQIYQRKHMDPAPMLYAYLGTDDREQIFNWFEKAYAEHSNVLTTLKVNPAYDPLRSDPRFKELERRVGLAE